MTKRVLIAGSGVAAVEAVLALRHLAGHGFEIDLVAPSRALEHRPASVAAPFGLGAPPPLDLHDLARPLRSDAGGGGAGRRRRRRADRSPRLGRGACVRLPAGRRRREPRVGAARGRSRSAGPRTWRWSNGCSRSLRAGIAGRSSSWSPRGRRGRCPRTSSRSWRGRRRARCPDATVTLVTPEREPLRIFGEAAGAAMRALLTRARDRPAHRRPRGARDRRRALARVRRCVDRRHRDQPSAARRARASPACRRPTTGSCRRTPTATSWEPSACSRPATPRPSRSSRAASRPSRPTPPPPRSPQELGAAVEPRPFAPVLRGLLLTGGAPLYLRAELDAKGTVRAGGARAPAPGGRGVLARAVVAARQGRRPLSRSVPVDGTSRGARRRAARRSRAGILDGRARRARRGARARADARRRGRGRRRPPRGPARARRGGGPGRRHAAARLRRAPQRCWPLARLA